MLAETYIKTQSKQKLADFLGDNGFHVEIVDDNVISIERDGELPVYAHIDSEVLFFEVDLGNIDEYADKALLFKLLDLNTEILPVSLGIDTTEKDDPRLVLVESREVENLDDNEVLSVMDAMELATEKVETILSEYVK